MGIYPLRQAKEVIKSLLFPPRPPLPQRSTKKWQDFSIGIYVGESPFSLAPAENIENPVLTSESVSDVPAKFIADPFMLKVKNTWYMFFEVLNQQTKKGEIGLATSEDGLKWRYQQIVLAEPYHHSYPYVFEWMNNYYMVPESYEAGSVRLYKALQFPTSWVFVGALLSRPLYQMRFVDASIFRYDGKWWLFTETDAAFKMDTLRFYYADHLLGPWFEHSKSPIVKGNGHIARPAGRVVIFNGRPIRYAQDCHPVYGAQVRAFEITTLSTKEYAEREVDKSPILTGSGARWNGDGMHHLDPHPMEDGRWIACVDGWTWAKVEEQNLVISV